MYQFMPSQEKCIRCGWLTNYAFVINSEIIPCCKDRDCKAWAKDKRVDYRNDK